MTAAICKNLQSYIPISEQFSRLGKIEEEAIFFDQLEIGYLPRIDKIGKSWNSSFMSHEKVFEKVLVFFEANINFAVQHEDLKPFKRLMRAAHVHHHSNDLIERIQALRMIVLDGILVKQHIRKLENMRLAQKNKLDQLSEMVEQIENQGLGHIQEREECLNALKMQHRQKWKVQVDEMIQKTTQERQDEIRSLEHDLIKLEHIENMIKGEFIHECLYPPSDLEIGDDWIEIPV